MPAEADMNLYAVEYIDGSGMLLRAPSRECAVGGAAAFHPLRYAAIASVELWNPNREEAE